MPISPFLCPLLQGAWHYLLQPPLPRGQPQAQPQAQAMPVVPLPWQVATSVGAATGGQPEQPVPHAERVWPANEGRLPPAPPAQRHTGSPDTEGSDTGEQCPQGGDHARYSAASGWCARHLADSRGAGGPSDEDVDLERGDSRDLGGNEMQSSSFWETVVITGAAASSPSSRASSFHAEEQPQEQQQPWHTMLYAQTPNSLGVQHRWQRNSQQRLLERQQPNQDQGQGGWGGGPPQFAYPGHDSSILHLSRATQLALMQQAAHLGEGSPYPDPPGLSAHPSLAAVVRAPSARSQGMQGSFHSSEASEASMQVR